MNLKRHGEESHTPFRNQRLYSENGQWYFDTREGKQFGPYKDKNEAGKALAIFRAQSVHNQNTDRTNKNDPHHGVQDGIESLVEELFFFYTSTPMDRPPLFYGPITGSRNLRKTTKASLTANSV